MVSPCPTPTLRLLLPALLYLAALTGCIRTDIGNTIDSIGKRVAKAVPARISPHHPNAGAASPFACPADLYRKDGKLYIDMPLVYVPERRRGYEYLNPMGSSYGVMTYRRPYSEEELTALPAERIVIAPGDVFLRSPTSDTATLTPPNQFRPQPRSSRRERGYLYMADEYISFTTAENFDRQSAEYLGRYYFYEARQVAQLLPARREWYNYALMPLSAVGYVADVPLSLASMLLTLPVSRELSPYMDYSTTYFPELSDTYVEPWHTSDN